jgi:hypothetical protein
LTDFRTLLIPIHLPPVSPAIAACIKKIGVSVRISMLDFTSTHHYYFMQDRVEKSGSIVPVTAGPLAAQAEQITGG